MTRCTCIYRPATDQERADGQPLIVVETTDPWCPAGDIHQGVSSDRPQ